MSQYVMTICHSVIENRSINVGRTLSFLDHTVETLELDIVSISDQFYPEISVRGQKSEPMIARVIVYESKIGPRRY